ncbi:GIY-YIG nuclease family protein [Rhodococcoides fascians]|uniref:GIY-YIG nuclease family protein n=1 Tax=Rhodococcoides fascians TaxID=1828 RepID=UPI00056042F3|nr:GIY-YIG nuclease family protein [Rhodococcus fascians]
MTQVLQEAVARWAEGHRFGPEIRFTDVRSSGLPADGPKESGYYLLRFDNDSYYLGESVDLRSRMGGHGLKWGHEIATVRLLIGPASKQELRRVERILTHELEATGVPLRNVLNASITSGVDALSELLDPGAQEEWSADPIVYNKNDQTLLKELTAQSIRYSTAARRYLEHSDEAAVTAILRTFIENCVPAPRATEFQYWSVSTGTYGGTKFPRRFCVSVGKMEVFVLNADKPRGGRLGGFVNVRESVLDSLVDTESFFADHPAVEVLESQYQDAGADTLKLWVEGLDDLSKLVSDVRVAKAAGALVLDLMRKHFCVYTRYHCPQLVERVYPGLERATGGETESFAPACVELPVAAESVPAMSIDKEPAGEIEDLGDVEIYWIVGQGSRASSRNQVSDFVARGEWRMDADSRYEAKVADMRAGERIAVRTRRNITENVPFDHHGHPVSVMDFHLRGVITHNPGDGCSVAVEWEDVVPVPPRFYLYTSQDMVWPMALGHNIGWNHVIGFAFYDQPQDVDLFRNSPFWSKRFGDR